LNDFKSLSVEKAQANEKRYGASSTGQTGCFQIDKNSFSQREIFKSFIPA